MGKKDLIIQSIKNHRGDILMDAEMIISPGSRKMLDLSYQPRQVGIINESLTISSNAPHRPKYYVFLSGYVEQGERIIITRRSHDSYHVINNTSEKIIVIPDQPSKTQKSIEPFKSIKIDLAPSRSDGELAISLGFSKRE